MKRKERPKCIVCGNSCKEIRYKYCSNQCQAAKTKDEILRKWITDPLSIKESNGLCPKTIKQFLRELYDNKCQLCGWNEINPTTNIVPLEVNHIDGNGFNNRLDNLQLICPNCHALTPNFKALNKNGSRKNRK
jgi:hypothetical protein